MSKKQPAFGQGQERIWEILLRPDFLFTIVTLQALVPYVFWELGAGRAIASNTLTYIPVLIWVVGWISFLAGCMLIQRTISSGPRFTLASSARQITAMTWILIGVGILELVMAVRLYGVLPILSYIRNDNMIDVVTATTLQENSFVGQIALLKITEAVMAGLLIESAIVALELKRKVPVVFYVGLLTILFIGIINGKRLDTVRIVIYLVCGIVLYSRAGIRNLTVLVPFARRSFWSIALLLGVFVGMASLFGPVAALRNQGAVVDVATSDEVIAYQEGPLLNMEAQCRAAGLGPFKFDLLFPLQGMVPIKWLSSNVFAKYPPREDPTSPSGLYEFIQWSWGLPGVSIFSALIGAVTMWLYVKSRSHAKYLLCYSYVVLSILLSHSFNEFLIAPLVLVPCILLWLIGTVANHPLRRRIPDTRKLVNATVTS